MNLVQLTEHVYKSTFMMNPAVNLYVNVWYIKDNDDVYIIDTGLPQFAEEQIKLAMALGTPKAIFLTHGHGDHITGAQKWVRQFDLPIYAHEDELVYINGEKPYPGKAEPEKTGVANRVLPLTQDVVANLPIKYYLTPGHAPGHVVYHHEADDILLTGDLFTTSVTALQPPIRQFSYDINLNIDKGAIVEELKPAIIASSHGEELAYQPYLYPRYVLQYRD